jgi:hypothetical protein
MRKYVFKFKDTDDEDFPEKNTFIDCFNPYREGGYTDIDESLDEFKKWMLARGFHKDAITNGVVYLHWNSIKDPDYNDEFLVTVKGKDYATIATFNDGEWSIPKEKIEAWAEVPPGYGRYI